MGEEKRYVKRHAAIAGGAFVIALPALLFTVFFLGLFLGVFPVACSAPLEELAPLYVCVGAFGSLVVSALAALLLHRWMRSRWGAANRTEG